MEMDGQLKPRNNIKMSKEVGKVIKVNKINSNDINERLSVDKKRQHIALTACGISTYNNCYGTNVLCQLGLGQQPKMGFAQLINVRLNNWRSRRGVNK